MIATVNHLGYSKCLFFLLRMSNIQRVAGHNSKRTSSLATEKDDNVEYSSPLDSLRSQNDEEFSCRECMLKGQSALYTCKQHNNNNNNYSVNKPLDALIFFVNYTIQSVCLFISHIENTCTFDTPLSIL